MGESKRKLAIVDGNLATILREPNPYIEEKKIEEDLYQDTIEALTTLRNDVDNLNKMFRNTFFKQRVIDGDEIMTVDVNGIRYGYKLTDLGVTMKRTILMKPINARFDEFNEEDRRKAIIPVFEVFLREGMSDIGIESKGGCIEITQEFAPMYLVERTQGPTSVLKGRS
jgi:hypothetical protein